MIQKLVISAPLMLCFWFAHKMQFVWVKTGHKREKRRHLGRFSIDFRRSWKGNQACLPWLKSRDNHSFSVRHYPYTTYRLFRPCLGALVGSLSLSSYLSLVRKIVCVFRLIETKILIFTLIHDNTTYYWLNHSDCALLQKSESQVNQRLLLRFKRNRAGINLFISQRSKRTEKTIRRRPAR